MKYKEGDKVIISEKASNGHCLWVNYLDKYLNCEGEIIDFLSNAYQVRIRNERNNMVSYWFASECLSPINKIDFKFIDEYVESRR